MGITPGGGGPDGKLARSMASMAEKSSDDAIKFFQMSKRESCIEEAEQTAKISFLVWDLLYSQRHVRIEWQDHDHSDQLSLYSAEGESPT